MLFFMGAYVTRRALHIRVPAHPGALMHPVMHPVMHMAARKNTVFSPCPNFGF